MDVTTYDKACTQSTQDTQAFIVLNSAGYRDANVPCITVDNKTPFFGGDPMSLQVLNASKNRLFTLLPPSDVMGKTTADVIAEQDLVPKSAKIGILSANSVQMKAGGDALEK